MRCLKCKGDIDDKSTAYIKWDGCTKPIHTACSELSQQDLKCLALRSTSSRRLKYICLECEQGVHQIPKLISMINMLQDEIQQLKNTIKANTTIAPSDSSFIETEKVINEITERKKHECNIIIFNVKESNGISKQEQNVADCSFVNDFISESKLNLPTVPPVRLGKFDATNVNRARPIKVTLSSPEDSSMIKNFKTLKSMGKWTHPN
ncbi:hypothetical protein Zmor_017280 [Zophobas morio]|uniref:PHD-type domain-containing protein n=1 Tax=Zophobas morio TaxID=2755281 RepID=A0AA38I9G4_9CUCU|nr:hypothetical protein Zmor_017280 [Zophobas morio]